MFVFGSAYQAGDDNRHLFCDTMVTQLSLSL